MKRASPVAATVRKGVAARVTVLPEATPTRWVPKSNARNERGAVTADSRIAARVMGEPSCAARPHGADPTGPPRSWQRPCNASQRGPPSERQGESAGATVVRRTAVRAPFGTAGRGSCVPRLLAEHARVDAQQRQRAVVALLDRRVEDDLGCGTN